MPNHITINEVRPRFRNVVRELRRRLGPTLAELKLTPVLDWDDDDSMQIIFRTADEESLSCVAVRFEFLEDENTDTTWKDAQLCRIFLDAEEVGNNGWLRLDDYGSFGVVCHDYATSEEAVDDIIESIRDHGTYGATADKCIYDERFDEAWPHIDSFMSSMVDFTEVMFNRDRRGSLVLMFEDGRERDIRLVLPKGVDQWRCYVGKRMVGEGNAADLLEAHFQAKDEDSSYGY
ncbi:MULTISPECIES: hypothetical protein [unclassified Rhizobium]|uniref:hypothetical protein n=1 Tax=unclassified Rhizobium TaxID=2613769 RepID=UPI001ADD4992|nr:MULTISPECIES: hypothetical protein [unclassified Rhizobium]MBO9127933.1 hypothetical protein [Rhizobium sp. 16-488-2b]MBO9178510.1 hypothetical protein [Rhizobium sp. 16-488-2a]